MIPWRKRGVSAKHYAHSHIKANKYTQLDQPESPFHLQVPWILLVLLKASTDICVTHSMIWRGKNARVLQLSVPVLSKPMPVTSKPHEKSVKYS